MTTTRRHLLKGVAAATIGLGGCIQDRQPDNRPSDGQSSTPADTGRGASHAQRDGATRQASSFSSLQEALDSLSPGDTLDIDRDYTTTVDIPATDRITITSSEGATLQLPSGDSGPIISWPDSPTSTTSTGSSGAAEGDQAITVEDSTPFSVGTDIRIIDENEYYRGVQSGEFKGGVGEELPTGEFHRVTGVDGNSLSLDSPIRHPYSNRSGSLRVEAVDWGVSDVIVSDLALVGHSGAGSSQQLSDVTNVTLENIRTEDWGSDSGNKILQIRRSWRVTVRDCHIAGGHSDKSKGININAGSTDVHVTGCTIQGMGRYGVNTGHGGGHHPTYGILVQNTEVRECESSGYDCHFGSENVRFRGCSAIDCYHAHKFRGWDIQVINGHSEGLSSDVFWFRQWPQNISVEEFTHTSGGNSVLAGYLDGDGLTIDKFSISDSQFEDGSDEFNAVDESDIGRTSVSNTTFQGEVVDEL